MLPFEQLVEVTGMQADTWFDYTAGMDMVTVNLLDSSEFEVKTAFRIAVLAFSERSCGISQSATIRPWTRLRKLIIERLQVYVPERN